MVGSRPLYLSIRQKYSKVSKISIFLHLLIIREKVACCFVSYYIVIVQSSICKIIMLHPIIIIIIDKGLGIIGLLLQRRSCRPKRK